MASLKHFLALVLALGLALPAVAAEEASEPDATPAEADAGTAAKNEPAADTTEAPEVLDEDAEAEALDEDAEAEALDEDAADAEAADQEAAAAEAATPPAEEEAAAAPPRHVVQLGPMGWDVAGKPGRVHTVVAGDTLWDISDAYLGTPWVWPSVWTENEAIENPHRIFPGDRLWITPSEMRRISDAEADQLLAGSPASADAGGLEGVDVQGVDGVEPPPPPTLRFSAREAAGLVSDAMLEGASSIVDAIPNRVWMGTMDPVHVALGQGDAVEGEQFTIFRVGERVYDPKTGKPLGWNVKILGWLEVKEVHAEVSRAEVRMAFEEMREGDRLLPREVLPLEVELRSATADVQGQIAFMPRDRFQSAGQDVVYLDRGGDHGLEVGNTVEVFRPVAKAFDPVSGEIKQVPDRLVAEMVIVTALPESAVAVVTEATTELAMGDTFRTVRD